MHDSIHPNRLNRSSRARLLAAAALISGVLVAGCGGGSGRARLLAAAVLVSGVLVAGCGGSSGGPTVANLASTTTSTSSAASTGAATTPESSTKTTSQSSTATGRGAASSGSTAPSDPEAEALAYSKCMRANGVPQFPDPGAGGGIEFHPGSGINPSSPAFKAAQTRCQKLMPGGGGLAPGAQTHPSQPALAQMLKVAQCMRRHGIYNFPEPRTSVPSNILAALGPGGGVISNIDGVILVFPHTIDQQSPLFTRAAAACDFPLHNH